MQPQTQKLIADFKQHWVYMDEIGLLLWGNIGREEVSFYLYFILVWLSVAL